MRADFHFAHRRLCDCLNLCACIPMIHRAAPPFSLAITTTPARAAWHPRLQTGDDERPQLPKVRRPQARDRVPARGRVEPGRAAPGVVPDRDVVERARVRGAERVQQRVQEAERRRARGEARRVEQRDDAGERRRRGGGAADGDGLARDEDAEEVRLRGDVGDRLWPGEGWENNGCQLVRRAGASEWRRTYAAVGVKEARVRAGREPVQELGHRGVLVRRAGELRTRAESVAQYPLQCAMAVQHRTEGTHHIAKSAPGEEYGRLGHVDRPADGSDAAGPRGSAARKAKTTSTAHKGHEGGKSGMKRVALRPSLVKHSCRAGSSSPSPTPPSPELNMSDTPRAPVCQHGRKAGAKDVSMAERAGQRGRR